VSDRRSLRKALRAARASIPAPLRIRAAKRIAALVARTGWLSPHRRVALYAALPNEIDTAPLLALANHRRCAIFMPRIVDHRRSRMVFVPPGPRLRINRYGIAEFDSSQRAAPWSMQYVFLPLVGFDARGNRLGMGAGFYDRALAFRRQRRHWRGPRLIGIAHSCQEAPSIEPLATDIPLDAVVTERGIRVFRGDFA
jgi:5-formyltetrahydrofolate cyclo-ligase